MSAIPFVREFDFEYGRCDQMSPRIRRVIAPNPGSFTFTGTGCSSSGQAKWRCWTLAPLCLSTKPR